MQNILILEDDRALARGIALALGSEEFDFIQCHSLAEADRALREREIHLAIFDVNLPDGSALSLLRAVRERSRLPVILLTANDLESDVVSGLELGADDYITKPFSLAILRARVHAQLRKASDWGGRPVVIDGFSFDFARMEFFRDGQAVELSRTEQRLLSLLVENRGRTLPRETLAERVWPDGAEYVDESALSVNVKRLRDKLEERSSSPRYIKTVYGVGYTWAVK